MVAPRTILLDKATTARYGQLTYTSFDDGSGRGGGWQVKQETGGIDAAEQQILTARILTRFDLLPVMPDFPTPEQAAMRPARLSYAVLGGGSAPGVSAAFWHTVDAGRDASGRPGNVFAHVVLDRDITASSPVRPIELWRSPGWLRPYGAPEVAAARLSSAYPPVANPAMSAARAIDFLLAQHTDRQAVFRVMLDAVAGAFTGGPALVLLVDDHDEAAAWISSISHFMSPAAARRFAFSTHDAPEVAAAGIELGLQLIVVPRARAGASAATGNGRASESRWELPGAVIIDAAEQPNLGDLASGIAHRVARGSVAVTPWSALAEGVLSDDEVATAVLARQDEVARELGDTGAVPAWSLAVAAAEHPDLAEFAVEAQRIIADGGSAVVAEVGWAKELVAQAQARFPLTAVETLERLHAAAEHGDDTAVPARRFLHTVLADKDLPGQLGEVPEVRTLVLGADDVALIAGQCATLRSRASDEPGDFSRRSARSGRAVVDALLLAELVERLAVVDDGYARAQVELLSVVEAGGVEFLWDTPHWVESGGLNALSAQVRATLIRPSVAGKSAQRIAQLRPVVIKWLFDVPDTDGVRFQVPANPTEADSFLFPLAVRAVLGTPDYVIPPVVRQVYVLDAIKLAVDDPRVDDPSCRDLVTDLVRLQVPDAAELVALSNAYPLRVSASVLATIVLTGAPDAAVLRKVIDARDADAALVAAATLRGWYGSGQVPPRGEWVRDVQTLAAGKDHAWLSGAAGDLVAMLAAGTVVAAQDDTVLPRGFTRALVARLPALAGAITDLVRAGAHTGQLDLNWLVAQSFLRHLRFAPTGTLLDDPAFGGWQWTDALLREAVGSGTYRGPRTDADLRDEVWPAVAAASAAVAERFFAGYREAAQAWRAALGLPAEPEGRGNRLWNRDDH